MLPRYSNRPLPPYRFVPGRNPHPTRDPDGHSYDQEPEHLTGFNPGQWRRCEPYLYGIDLFNRGYWWEAHEALEAVWVAAGRRTEAGLFVQGLIQIAVACLKQSQGFHAAARNMAYKGLDKLGRHRGRYLGIDVAALRAAVTTGFSDDPGTSVIIELR